MREKTEQERLWAGQFGSDYINRNRGNLAANVALFARILKRTRGISSVIEFGANIGENLDALTILLPHASQTAVEIHPDAADICSTGYQPAAGRIVNCCAIQDFDPAKVGGPPPMTEWDLTFTKGVLIHIEPKDLPLVYDKLYRHSRRYIMVAEYYNPQPYSVTYRGVENALHKRDFAGEMLDRFASISAPLDLIDYGFVYYRDQFKQDSLNWFLMEKR